MRVFVQVSAIACASVFVAACIDRTPVAPPPVGSLTASVTQLQERSHPNSQKYRDRGFHPASGSAGAATVSTRALLDKSGMTEVEVTTGTFEDPAGAPPAPGALSKVQVKAFTPSGDLAFTTNYTGLSGGSARFPFANLPHGATVQVQTLVGEADARTDVVTLRDVVHLRPDLVAARIDAPAQAPLGAAVNLQGFIREGNGEVGARADCVLYVDGTAVDRASGIWVDAAGIVACAMTHVFTEARSYALELRVENVRPGDFDDANNGVSSSITIASSGVDYFGLAAQSYQSDGWWRSVSTLTTAEGIEETWDQTYHVSGPNQSASAAAIVQRVLTTPITLRGAMSTNGVTLGAIEHTYETLEWIDWRQAYFGSQYDFATGTATYVSVYPDGSVPGYTWVQYDCGGADVRYHTESYVTYWDPSGQLNARWIYEDYSDTRPMVTYGPDFSASLSIQGADDVAPVAGQLTVQLEPVEFRFDFSSGDCSTLPGSPDCFEFHSHSVGVLGYGGYGSWPQP